MTNGKCGVLLLASVLLCSRAFADHPLPQTRQAAIAMEAKDALPLTAFYDPPDRGFEREIRKRLDYWAKLRKERTPQ